MTKGSLILERSEVTEILLHGRERGRKDVAKSDCGGANAK